MMSCFLKYKYVDLSFSCRGFIAPVKTNGKVNGNFYCRCPKYQISLRSVGEVL
jgi:hypothetical protein